METLKIEILDISNFNLPQYVFNEPKIVPIPSKDVQGKTLDQVEEEYGSEMVESIYWSVMHGKDPTKITLPECDTRNVVVFRKEETEDSLDVYICANAYTVATEDRNILHAKFSSKVDSDARKELIIKYINYLFRKV